MRARTGQYLAPAIALIVLSGCIPQGANDYRIGAASEQIPTSSAIAEPATAEEPTIVPEHEIIADTPSWSPAVVERNAILVEPIVYLVQPGDGLYRIESKTGAGVDQIIAANGLAVPYSLKVGQNLTIPGGLYHRVGRGETGIAIARAYASNWADIVEVNGLTHPYVLREGQRLRLPDAASAVPISTELTPEQRAASFSLDIDDIVTGGEPALAASTSIAPSYPPAIRQPGAFSGSFNWPLSGSLINRFGSFGSGKINDGINIAGALGAPVKSAADGVVVYSGNEIGVFGGLVLVDHGGGWVTAYGHLGQLDVTRGDSVKAGELLGAVGDTGYVSQPQLHFEIRKDRKPIDPLTKLTAR